MLPPACRTGVRFSAAAISKVTGVKMAKPLKDRIELDIP